MKKRNSILKNLDYKKPLKIFGQTFGYIAMVIAIIAVFFQNEANKLFTENITFSLRTFCINLLLLIIIFIFFIIFFSHNLNKFYKSYSKTKQLEINNENRIHKIKELKSENDNLRNTLILFKFLVEFNKKNILNLIESQKLNPGEKQNE